MFGQELNPELFAICKANTLIKGQDVRNIRFGNTLSDDDHPERKFDYMLSNPPFGVEWKKVEAAVRKGAAGHMVWVPVFDADLPLDHDGPVDWPFEPFPDSALRGSVVDRFDEIARRFSDRPAVTDGVRAFTYGQLAHHAGAVAEAIEGAAAGRPGPVAVLLANEARYPAAMLGALATGRGYLALDIDHPPERNRRIAVNAAVAAVISVGSGAATARQLFNETPIVDMQSVPEADDRPLQRRAQPDDVAWIIYTSGSTGQPKGVFQNQRGMLHDILQSTNSLHLSPADRQVLFASPSLLSGTRIAFGSLLNGGSIHCLSPNRPDISRKIVDLGITVLRAVPAVFRNVVRGLAPEEKFDSLRLVLLGGDRVEWSDYLAFCRACGPKAVFGSHLGSTECSTLYLQWFLRQGASAVGQRLPVGRPIPERQVALLADDGTPVADGDEGEFVVSSRYMAQGYWRAPELTAGAFAVDPTDPSVRKFRTGDLGCRRRDGLFEFHGRKDQQMKIHGFRIEPGEIENALRSCLGVLDGAIVVRCDAAGVPRAVVAYVELLPATRGLLPHHVRAMLAKRVPKHMIPAVVVIVDALPRLPNLKLDRVRLTTIDKGTMTQTGRQQSELADEVARIFEAVLGVDDITADDNVLTLGGDSLQAVAIANALEERFGFPFEIGGEPPTIGELAVWIGARLAGGAEAAARA
jgi:amino acid adenylation domain-containing protein